MWTVIVSDQRGEVIARHEWSAGSLTIGRDQGRSIALPSKTASRKHCRLDLINGVPVVVDEGSANGTLVNGGRISAPTRLDDTSKVDVGEFRITLAKADKDESERTLMMRPRMPIPPPVAAPPPPPQAAPPPKPAPPPPPKLSYPEPVMPSAAHGDAATSQFDRHLQSVRAYREESQAATLNRKGRVDAGWVRMIEQAKALQTRLSADKRVMSFTISRDQKEVAVKIADSYEKRGYRYFLLCRDHPEGKYPGQENCWLREFGRDDASFDEAAKAMEELMLRVAGTLA